MIEALIDELTAAYNWLCARRKNAGPNHDVWHVRLHWESIGPQLEQALHDSTFHR